MMSVALDSPSSHSLASSASTASAPGASSCAEKASTSEAQAPATRSTSHLAASAVVAKPFDRSLFRAFLTAASRLFCDDDQIIIVDFLAHHEKAYTERDLIERLGWPDRRVREACAALERMQLVAKEQLSGVGSAAARSEKGASTTQAPGNAGPRGNDSVVGSSSGSTVSSSSGAGGSSSPNQPSASSSVGAGQASQSAPFYFKISPFCLLVFHFRLQRAEQQVEENRRAAEGRDVFFCPKCSTKYDALEAQLLDVDPRDAHFLCKFCDEKLEHEDSKVALQQAISLQQRCEKQLQTIRTLVRRGWNMEVPSFPPYSRAERSAHRNRPADEAAKSSVGAGSTTESAVDRSGSSGSGLGADDTMSDTSLPGAGTVQLQMRQGLAGSGETGARRQTPAWVMSEQQAGEAAASACASPPLARSASAGVISFAAAEAGALGSVSSQARLQGAGSDVSAASARPGTASQGAGGSRNQIRFSMKGSLSGTGSKSASVSFGSMTRGSVPRPGGAQPVHASLSRQTGRTSPADAGKAPSASEASSAHSQAVDCVAAAHPAKRPRAAAAVANREAPEEDLCRARGGVHAGPGGPAGLASAVGAHEASAGVEASALERTDTDASAGLGGGGSSAPLFFVGKLGREMTLEEAAEFQLEMTAEEHERFMELQAVYLDDI
ncbi:general transcription factor IIE polypeptide 1 GTF2E1 [Toxoplasma gondii VAND]|uniref:General transcription factor IIE polypeptide 1 GTF2E1 n=1 Tax=Toxoplasma gondii VAND TaxID=933077 RepID=A0A086QEP3_TOXGO|nr:general transcription factor IIE polypeptide 1 GTF2E1 [Toxoplasma gondii VAND]